MLMKYFVAVCLASAVLVDFFSSRLGAVGKLIGMIPEGLGAVVVLLFFHAIATGKTVRLPKRYAYFGLAFMLFAVTGWIANQVQPGAVVGGIRNFFRFIPFFLIPFLWHIPDSQIQRLLKLCLALAFVQIPVVLYQRFLEFGILHSGDHVTGTLALSSLLSVWLIMVLSVLLAFFLRQQLGLPKFLLLAACVFFPTTLNETKGTFFLLPFAFLVPAIYFAVTTGRVKQLIPVIFGGALFFVGFIVLYNASIGSAKEGRDLIGFLTDERELKRYFIKEEEDRSKNRFGYSAEVGRVDAIEHAYRTISRDPGTLLMGMGIGNLSVAPADVLEGEVKNYEQFIPQYHVISILLWETGLIGLTFALVGFLLAVSDARTVYRLEGISGTLALGWLGVLTVFFLALPYKHIINSPAIPVLFWFFCGILAQRAALLRSNSPLLQRLTSS